MICNMMVLWIRSAHQAIEEFVIQTYAAFAKHNTSCSWSWLSNLEADKPAELTFLEQHHCYIKDYINHVRTFSIVYSWSCSCSTKSVYLPPIEWWHNDLTHTDICVTQSQPQSWSSRAARSPFALGFVVRNWNRLNGLASVLALWRAARVCAAFRHSTYVLRNRIPACHSFPLRSKVLRNSGGPLVTDQDGNLVEYSACGFSVPSQRLFKSLNDEWHN